MFQVINQYREDSTPPGEDAGAVVWDLCAPPEGLFTTHCSGVYVQVRAGHE